MISSEIARFNKAHDLVATIEKMNGRVELSLPFLYHAIFMILQGDFKRAVESLTDAANLMHMAV